MQINHVSFYVTESLHLICIPRILKIIAVFSAFFYRKYLKLNIQFVEVITLQYF